MNENLPGDVSFHQVTEEFSTNGSGRMSRLLIRAGGGDRGPVRPQDSTKSITWVRAHRGAPWRKHQRGGGYSSTLLQDDDHL